ncbi:hypothetical protein [Novosphingobium beihaiensis]|uniref:Cellulose biosynthesis protein BcsF n=1 Tax=Novosphingobium beihaiensis TaxID=2930389 RepID=A0ABT0BVT7_9SPHN|nr:hypothetical protein [Novosphingobium beihaiensis]MCJ2189167.1 hypothetical protein [Novosphingobium beihaiensis]
MTWPVILILLASVATMALGYWRALRLHIRIRQIEPRCPWVRTHFLARPPHRPRNIQEGSHD